MVNSASVMAEENYRHTVFSRRIICVRLIQDAVSIWRRVGIHIKTLTVVCTNVSGIVLLQRVGLYSLWT